MRFKIIKITKRVNVQKENKSLLDLIFDSKNDKTNGVINNNNFIYVNKRTKKEIS